MKRTYDPCPICSRLISKQNMSKHIRSHENGKQRKIMYHLDHDDLFCKFCNKEYKNKNALVQHEVRCKQNLNKIDTSHSFGNNLGRPSWNKGLTKETDARVKQYTETRLKHLELGIIKGNKGCKQSQETKDKISRICLNKSKNGTWHTSLAKHMHYNYKGNDLHGTWELMYAIYLDQNNIRWLRNKDRFEYTYQEKIHYYTPDFYLIDTDEYIEIKGYSNGKDYAKWKQFPKNKKLIILKYKELLDLGVFNIDISNFLKNK